MTLIPQSLAGRTLAVLLIGLTVSHLASMVIHYTDRHEAFVLFGGGQIADRIATINRLIAETPLKDRPALIRNVSSPILSVQWARDRHPPENAATDWRTELTEEVLRLHLGASPHGEVHVMYSAAAPVTGMAGLPGGPRMPADHAALMQEHMRRMLGDFEGAQTLWVELELPDKSWLRFSSPFTESVPFLSLRFVLSMLVMAAAVVGLSFWAVRHLTGPLDRFARAAERLGVDVEAPPLPEAGSREVKRAAAAFNEMQRRIRRLIDDRTQMLAAISHDLRTPITRMRLRAESIDQPDLQNEVLSDLAEMEAMVASTLAFARDDAKAEETVVIDLTAMLHTVCDGLTDMGGDVTFEPDRSCLVLCRPSALRRALTNVIDNAVKYGKRATVTLGGDARTVRVVVDDDGPGVPEDQIEKIFSPFYRLERSRSRETGGAGLGLSIARSIVRAHGGDISIRNRRTGGLEVTVGLPATTGEGADAA